MSGATTGYRRVYAPSALYATGPGRWMCAVLVSTVLAFLVTAARAAAPVGSGWLKGGVEIVVTDGEGGISGTLARMMQPGLQERLGVPVTVKTLTTSMAGAAHQYVRQQSRNRPTFLMGNPSLMGALDGLDRHRSDARDFEPVSHLVDYPFGIVVSKKVVIYDGAQAALRLVSDVDDEAEANAHIESAMQINAIDKVMGVNHIAQFMAWLGTEGGPEVGVAETRPLSGLLAVKLGAISNNDVRLVKYSSSSHLAQGLRQGRVQAVVAVLPAISELLKVDGMNLLAVTSKRRLQMLPDVPTLYESGLGVGGVSWEVLYAPKNLSASTQKTVSDALQNLFQDREFRKKLRSSFFTPVGSNAQAAAEMVDMFEAYWTTVIRKSLTSMSIPQVGASHGRDR